MKRESRGMHAMRTPACVALALASWLAHPAAVPAATDSLVAADSTAAIRDSTALADSLRTAIPVLPVASATPETLSAPGFPRGVPVFLGGRELFRVRVARGGLDPAQRAAAIRQRIAEAVANRGLPADSTRLVLTPEGIEVRLGPRFLWVVTPADAGISDLATLALSNADLATRVREGIERERTSRRPTRLLLSLLFAIILTLAAWGMFRTIRVSARRWRAWVRLHVVRRVPGLRVRGFDVLPRRQMAGMVLGVLGRLDLPLYLVLLYAYLAIVFSLFPWTQGWGWLLLHHARTQSLALLQTAWSSVPSIMALAIIAVVLRWLLQLSQRFFAAIEAGAFELQGFHPELARPSRRLVRILLWVVAAVVAYPFIPGSQTRAFQGVSILLGVMVSLGSTGFVSNVIAGIVLTYSRSFRIGDRVRIGDHVGDVQSLGFIATKLRSLYNEDITIPNGQVTSGPIVNYTRLAAEPGLLLHLAVTLGYDVPWRTVGKLMAEAAAAVSGVEAAPAPRVLQRSLNDHHVTYELQCVTKDSHAQMRLYSDLCAGIQDAFARAGIEILSPSFHALRDASAPALPAEPGGPRSASGAGGK